MINILMSFGTRPEAIKMAPLYHELKRSSQINTKLLVTAQHREMLDQVLEIFGIVPDYDLDIMKTRQSLSSITSKVLIGVDKALEEGNYDLVLVHGDTNTTFATALAAFYRNVPVAHVEAGLRSGSKNNPFPEELNRRLSGLVADIHFAPTATNKHNLLRECNDGEIFVTGNTVIDALMDVSSREGIDETLSLPLREKVITLTAHRRENQGEIMEGIFNMIKELAIKREDVSIVFPVHLNPVIVDLANQILANIPNVHLIKPLGYESFARLLKKSYLVLTDSGGLQEEAPALGVPVVLMRVTTERMEAIHAGTVIMAGTRPEEIIKHTLNLIEDKEAHQRMSKAINPYGDGHASRRIREYIEWKFGHGIKPEEFDGSI